MYEYKATYIRNYDGDTVTLSIDVGFKISIKMNIRLYGINTPELRSSILNEKGRAVEAKLYVQKALSSAKEIIIKTERDKSGKYGRYLATIFYDNKNLNQELLIENLADPY